MNLSRGGGVQEEVAPLDLVSCHPDRVAVAARILAREIVSRDLFGEVIEPKLEGRIIAWCAHALVIYNVTVGYVIVHKYLRCRSEKLGFLWYYGIINSL